MKLPFFHAVFLASIRFNTYLWQSILNSMENFVEILVIIVVVTFAVVKQISKSSKEEKKKYHETDPSWENEEMEDMEYERTTPAPFLSYEHDLYHSPSKATEQSPRKKQTKKTKTPPPVLEEPVENKEFNIQSTEEVRRGIIWSEILNRKY